MNFSGTPGRTGTLKVSEVNNYIKSVLQYDPNLSGIRVTGEISNFKVYSSGHAYFSLKDTGGVLKCVMFSGSFRKMTFRPSDGMKVIAFGNIGVYERDGVYQLYVESMQPDGVGALYEKFEKLKQKLYAEGLFKEGRGRAVPLLPRAVAVVTSPSGAVIRDIENVVSRRFPGMPVILYPAAVQGSDAPGELLRGLLRAQEENKADVIIIGRGGGSIEDLWAFNDEALARAVFASTLPVISAVGHETDFTICDYVADLRAPTPSAAAELAVPELAALEYELSDTAEELISAAETFIKFKRHELDRMAAALSAKSLSQSLDARRQLLDRHAKLLVNLARSRTDIELLKLSKAQREMNALSYENVLERGFAVVKNEHGAILKSAAELRAAGRGRIMMADGETEVDVRGSE